jgi:MoxR-like ATPase
MRLSQVKNRIRALENADLVAMLLGGAGLGKSDGVKQCCKEDGVEMIDVRLNLLNPVDVRGFPIIDHKNGVVKWVPATFFANKGPCRIFFDELPNAPVATQQAAYQLVLDKMIGELKLDTSLHTTKTGHVRPKQTIIAAGNRTTDQAFVNPMPAPLRNRMVLIDVEPHFEDWRNWAYDNGVDSRVINFLTYSAREAATLNIEGAEQSDYGLLYWFDPKRHPGAFPTPRSWEFVSRYIKANPKLATDTEVIAGMVSAPVATKLVAFIKIADKLPDAEEVLKGNLNLTPPSSKRDPGALYAYCGALCAALMRVEDKADRVQATRNVASYCVKHWENDAEFAILTMKDFARTDAYQGIYRKVITTKEWKTFTKAFKDLMV